jgi:hypothetical protein
MIAGGSTNGRKSGADDQYWRFWFGAVWAEIARVAKPTGFGFIHCDWRMVQTLGLAVSGGRDRQTASGWALSQVLAWDREHIGLGTPYRNSFELIAFVRGPAWRMPEDFPRDIPTVVHHYYPYGTHKYHGAEKPVALYPWLLGPHGCQTVLDPFMGSGTTGVACVQTGRNCIGIEIDPTYYAIAERRIAEAQAQLALPMAGAVL